MAQIHALWTLEGMGKLDAKVIISLLEIDNSKNPQVTIHALRLAEQFSSENSVYKEVLENSLFKIVRSKNSAISLQLVLSSGNFSPKFNFKVLLVVLEPMIDEPIFRDAALSSLYDHEFLFCSYYWNKKHGKTKGAQELFLSKCWLQPSATNMSHRKCENW